MLILNEKHEKRYIYVPENKLAEIELIIIKQRNLEGWWYADLNPRERKLLDLILTGDTKPVPTFFQLRRSAEYED